MELPFELLGLVFTHLPPKDLDTVQLVCKAWRDIASDKIWKEQFYDYFGTTDICPVSSYFTRWRRELILRKEVLQKWKRCAKVTDYTINSNLTDNTHIFCNFATDAPRATCFNSHQGAGNIIELDRGKIKRRIYASRYAREVLPVTTADGSRFGLLNAFLDGSATAILFSRDGTVATEHKDLPYKHETAISAVWIAKSRNFMKNTYKSIGIATGSFDGTVVLNSVRGIQRFQMERSPLLMLEGCMYGSYAANDGDTIVALYRSGAIYRFDCSGNEIHTSKVAQLPMAIVDTGSSLQLHMCNGYAIVQTSNLIFVIDLMTKAASLLDIPSHAEITAFSIDKSYTPGTKHMIAGLSTNEICTWELPPINVDEPNYSGPSITIVKPTKARSSGSVSDEKGLINNEGTTDIPGLQEVKDIEPEIRQVKTKPNWTIYNPIGYEQRLEQSEKPQITRVALNSAVALVAGYNGMVMALDIFTGRPLKRISSRISKNVLDLVRYSRDGFVPVTQLEIDPNPLRLRGVICVRPAVQFFDLGLVGLHEQTNNNGSKRGSRQKHRGGNPTLKNVRLDIEEDIQLRDEFEEIDAEQDALDATLAEGFSMDGMGEEEQLAYAVMLSEQQERAFNEGEYEANDEEDADLRLALELSSVGEQVSHEDTHITTNNEAGEHESDDEDLRRAIALSLQSS